MYFLYTKRVILANTKSSHGQVIMLLSHWLFYVVQKKSEELERQLEAVEGERKKLEAEAKEHREKTSELESSHQKTQLELTSQLEEVKMKVCNYTIL